MDRMGSFWMLLKNFLKCHTFSKAEVLSVFLFTHSKFEHHWVLTVLFTVRSKKLKNYSAQCWKLPVLYSSDLMKTPWLASRMFPELFSVPLTRVHFELALWTGNDKNLLLFSSHCSRVNIFISFHSFDSVLLRRRFTFLLKFSFSITNIFMNFGGPNCFGLV